MTEHLCSIFKERVGGRNDQSLRLKKLSILSFELVDYVMSGTYVQICVCMRARVDEVGSWGGRRMMRLGSSSPLLLFWAAYILSLKHRYKEWSITSIITIISQHHLYAYMHRDYHPYKVGILRQMLGCALGWVQCIAYTVDATFAHLVSISQPKTKGRRKWATYIHLWS